MLNVKESMKMLCQEGESRRPRLWLSSDHFSGTLISRTDVPHCNLRIVSFPLGCFMPTCHSLCSEKTQSWIKKGSCSDHLDLRCLRMTAIKAASWHEWCRCELWIIHMWLSKAAALLLLRWPCVDNTNLRRHSFMLNDFKEVSFFPLPLPQRSYLSCSRETMNP